MDCRAALTNRTGTIFLRRAEGMKFRGTRSGELRTQAFSVARRMGTTIRTVYIVPAGRGHLTNAFGMSRAIGLTDSLGQYLTRPQFDYVIAHEVAHVKNKHGMKTLAFVVVLFLVLSLLFYRLPNALRPWRYLLDSLVIAGPLVALYSLSRKFEYAADREAVDFTGASETAVRALARLCQVTKAPIRCSKFSELFLTHPTLTNRIQAILQTHPLPAERVTNILRDVGIA